MMRVIGDRVLVQLPPKESETTTESGLVLVRDPDLRTQTRGIVVQLGEKSRQVDLDDVRSEVHTAFVEYERSDADRFVSMPAVRVLGDAIDSALMRMGPGPFDVAVGDCVLFSASAGEHIDVDGTAYVILHETDLIGIVDPKSEAA